MKNQIMLDIAKALNFYMRIVFLVLTATASAFILFAGAKAALATTLKPVSVISGEALTVGDIFDGIEADKAAYILGPGPAPGKDMVLDARSLMRIAIALDLPWRPDSSADSITIRRDATVIDSATLDAGMRSALLSKGLDAAFEITYTGGAPTIALKPGLPATFDVTTLEIDRTRDTFKATITAPSADDPQSITNVSGTIHHMVMVPVLRTTLKNGDLIGERDLDMIEIYARDLNSDMVLATESLIGLTPRRVVAAGKPIRPNDLITPELVSRGENVTLVFDSAPLYLTAKGKALQNGGKGDLVRVVNIASNRSIEGIITGSGQVTVTP